MRITFDTAKELNDFINKIADKISERNQGTQKPMKKFLTAREAADILGITPDRIRRPEVRANMKHVKLSNGHVMFDADSVLAYVSGREPQF